jgi:hypothetical protein
MRWPIGQPARVPAADFRVRAVGCQWRRRQPMAAAPADGCGASRWLRQARARTTSRAGAGCGAATRRAAVLFALRFVIASAAVSGRCGLRSGRIQRHTSVGSRDRLGAAQIDLHGIGRELGTVRQVPDDGDFVLARLEIQS